MNDLFRPYLRRFMVVFFLNDILIYSENWTSHFLHHLDFQVLQVMHCMLKIEVPVWKGSGLFGVKEVGYIITWFPWRECLIIFSKCSSYTALTSPCVCKGPKGVPWYFETQTEASRDPKTRTQGPRRETMIHFPKSLSNTKSKQDILVKEHFNSKKYI